MILPDVFSFLKNLFIFPGCDSDQFTCSNGQCITGTWVCDKDEDCDDGSDEVDCGKFCFTLLLNHLQFLKNLFIITGCDSDQFTCSNGQCIPGKYYCDNGEDCNDGSDEDCDCTWLFNFFYGSECNPESTLWSVGK